MFGHICLTISAIAQLLGPFIADYNHTHVLNPNWPPHARFHNGQTMSMGVCLSLATLYYTWRPTAIGNASAAADSLFTAALFGSMYWLTAMSGILYPGAKAIDPEFGTGFPQLPLFLGCFVASWLGWWVETPRLGSRGVRAAEKRL